MKQIRHGVFETNSSSTHSICITKGAYNLPNSVRFQIGEFGWEFATLDDDDKCSYFYTALLAADRTEDIKKLKEMLSRLGIDYDFSEPIYEEYPSGRHLKNGYIDHSGDLYDFLDDLMSHEDKLLRFLFSDESFIWTGNDNAYECDIPDREEITYPHEMYYK